MDYHKRLDFVLKTIAQMDKGKKEIFEIKNALTPETIEHGELLVLLNHLVEDKMLHFIKEDIVFNGGAVLRGDTYQITFHALLFLEKSSYKKEKSKTRLMDIWNKAKILIVTLNALATLYLMYVSAFPPLDENSKSIKSCGGELQNKYQSDTSSTIKTNPIKNQ